VLVRVSTSQPSAGLALQSAKPTLQVKPQRAPVHDEVALATAGQTVPQAPQLRGSVLVLVQLPAQLTRPLAQVTTQVPAEHTWPAAHIRPHVPQLLRSTWRSRQVPEQLV
jgi:hypothetical protein